ncbi:MAG: ankyrin repeat domain-containing protein [Armatimonas sp.]
MFARLPLIVILAAATVLPTWAQHPAIVKSVAGSAPQKRPSDAELIQALEDENIARALNLIRRGANPNSVKTESDFKVKPNALGIAAELGDITLVKALLEHGAQVNPKASSGKQIARPLDSALGDKRTSAIARLLVEKGAALNEGDGSKLDRRPIVVAASWGDVELVRLMLEKGADWKHTSSDKINALVAAVSNGSIPIVELLVARGATLDDPDLDALGVASGSVPMLQWLLDHGVKLKQVPGSEPLLIEATLSGKAAMIRFIAQYETDVDRRGLKGYNPLHIAAETSTEAVKTLLALKARVDILSPDEQSVLDIAEDAPASQKESIIQALKAAGAKPAPPSLIKLIRKDDLAGVKKLLEQGVDPNRPDGHGGVPLFYAFTESRESEKAASMLLTHGANPNGKAPDGRGLMVYLRDINEDRAMAMLRRAGGYSPELELRTALSQKSPDRAAVENHLNNGVVPDASALALALLHKDRPLVDRLLEKGAPVSGRAYLPDGDLIPITVRTPPEFPLHAAALSGDVELVRLLLDKGANANQRREEDSPNALHYIGQSEATPDQIDAVVRLLVERGADVHAIQSDMISGSPLAFLAATALPKTLEYLLEHGAISELRPKDSDNQSPLSQAISARKRDNIQLLLERGSDSNETDATSRSLLAKLIETNNLPESEAIAIGKLLVQHGANLNIRDSMGRTPLQIARDEDKEEIAKWLQSLGGQQRISRETEMRRAIMSGDADTVRQLLKAGFNPNTLLDDSPPLALACTRDEMEIAQLLIQAGADINKPDSIAAPLYKAAGAGNSALVRLLLQRGAKVEQGMMIDGQSVDTPLSVAAKSGSLETVKLLVAAKANVNAGSVLQKGQPLQAAILHGHLEIQEFLLKSGADPNLGAPLVHLVVLDNTAAVEKLIKAGAKIDQSDESGMTALMSTAMLGTEKMMRFLLKYKPNVHLKDAEGRTALSFAKQEKKTGIIALLRKAGATR